MLFAFEAAIFHRSLRAISGHRLGLSAVCIACLAASLPSEALAEGEIVDFRPATQVGSFRQAKVVVEAEGKLKLNADGQEVKHLPLKVQGELQYVERVIAQSKQWTEARLVRSYQAAEAKIRLHESELSTELRPERRLIAVESSASNSVLNWI
jgi:hypothetical protein